jgi:16S rRNA (adenine1518-N6/adenine1519-N6)-dimethyltransferase
LRLKKSLGQSFLINGGKAQRIAEAAVETLEGLRFSQPQGPAEARPLQRPLRVIVEIGPGLGALTVPLAEAGARVVAFEIDERLREALEGVLREYPNATVVWGDFLHAEVGAAVGGEAYVAAGNLPYQITAPLLEKLFGDPLCRALVITVQKEVATRLQAEPGGKDYGPLTLFCQYHVQKIETIVRLAPGDFLPPPQVESVALRMVKRTAPPFVEPSAEQFRRAVRAAFAHRRKTLAAGLALASKHWSSETLDLRGLAGETPAPRGLVEAALQAAGIDGGRRAETLSLEEFARLGQALGEGSA